jgi:hypothetical protein
MFWMQQSDDARFALLKGDPINEVLDGFAEWLADWDVIDGVWGNGATFDNVLLTETYLRARRDRPWSYRADRCFRTAKAMSPHVEPPEFEGIEHHALHDAIWQAQFQIKIGLPL